MQDRINPKKGSSSLCFLMDTQTVLLLRNNKFPPKSSTVLGAGHVQLSTLGDSIRMYNSYKK